MTGQAPRTGGQRERVHRLKDARRFCGQDTPEPSRETGRSPALSGEKAAREYAQAGWHREEFFVPCVCRGDSFLEW